MDRGVWWATVHGVAKRQTQLSDLTLSLLCYIRTLQCIFQSGKYCKTLNDQHGYLMYKNMNTEA